MLIKPNNFVPYTGAFANLDLGGFDLLCTDITAAGEISLTGSAIISNTTSTLFLTGFGGLSLSATTGNMTITAGTGDINLNPSGVVSLDDNKTLVFGTANDIPIVFNGSYLNIDLVGVTSTGYLNLDLGNSAEGYAGSTLAFGLNRVLINSSYLQTNEAGLRRTINLVHDLDYGATNLTSKIQTFYSNQRIASASASSGTITLIEQYVAAHSMKWANMTGTITEWNGFVAWGNWNANFAGTLTDLTGFRVKDWNVAIGGTFTNAYGLRIDDITAATNNYSLYTGKGQMRLGDNTASTLLGFFGQTPVVRQTTSSQPPAAFVANTSGISDDTATWGGYTVGDLVAILQAYGLLT